MWLRLLCCWNSISLADFQQTVFEAHNFRGAIVIELKARRKCKTFSEGEIFREFLRG